MFRVWGLRGGTAVPSVRVWVFLISDPSGFEFGYVHPVRPPKDKKLSPGVSAKEVTIENAEPCSTALRFARYQNDRAQESRD